MPIRDSVPLSTSTNVTSSISGVTISGSPKETPVLQRAAAELAGPLLPRDGTALHQRAIRADDAPRLQAFHGRLSRQTILFRFFGVMPVLSGELAGRLSHVDYENSMAVVATSEVGVDEPIIAVARYQRTAPRVAEIALAVEDRWQGRGIGPQLLRTLAVYACRQGFTTFVADVIYDNGRMLALLRHSGFPTTMHLCDGRVEARLDISGLDTQTAADRGIAPRAECAI